MIIDMEKVKVMCEHLEKSFLDMKVMLKECEIDNKDCEKCAIIYYPKGKTCNNCYTRPTLVDNFVEKQNELDGLFIGAPIMHIDTPASIDAPKLEYYNKTHHFMRKQLVRLPTIKQCPRNTWLAPWSKMPKELYELNVLLWAKNGEIILFIKGKCEPNNVAWKNVIKLQIIED